MNLVAAAKPRMVIFATPSLDHRVCIDFHVAVSAASHLLAARGIASGHLFIGGDCYLARVRNMLVGRFLREVPDATDLFFIDDDLGFDPAAVLALVERPEAVVAGVYPKKSDDLDFPVELAGDIETGTLIERDGMVAATALPGGFIRLRRDVLEALAASAPTFKAMDRGAVVEYPSIFSMGVGEDGFFWGEDFVFSQKLMELGHQLWVDPSIRFSHRGGKAWSATLAEHLPAFRARAVAARRDAAE